MRESLGYRCQECGSDERLEAHHLTYERFGHERPEDLQVLCHFCHMAEHGLPVSGVGPVAGPTVGQPSRAVRQREALENQQAGTQLAAYLSNHLDEFVEALGDHENRQIRKRAKYVAQLWGRLIEEVRDGSAMPHAKAEAALHALVSLESAA